MEGKDEVLRLIASTMIREFVDNGQDVCEFLPVGNYPDPSGFFQDKKKYTSQWTTEFVDYVDNLDDPGIMAKELVFQGGHSTIIDTKIGEICGHLLTPSPWEAPLTAPNLACRSWSPLPTKNLPSSFPPLRVTPPSTLTFLVSTSPICASPKVVQGLSRKG